MTLLIKNVQLIDGVHEFPERADVFVAQGKISAIGNFASKPAATVIDGQGAYLAPGFIDVDTDSDHYLTLFKYRSQADFLKQGVTTIFGGLCGSSLAPLLYGELDAMEAWSVADRHNVNWHTVAEFLKVLDKRPLGVNFGTLAGHATIRRAITGPDGVSRELTKNERAVFEKTLRRAFEEGAFGVSIGPGYVHGRESSGSEMKWLAGLAREVGAVFAVHLRNARGEDPKDFFGAVKDVVSIGNGSSPKTLLSHLIPLQGLGVDYEKSISLIDGLPAQREVRFDAYPINESILPFAWFLPLWAQADVATMVSNARDEWFVKRIIKDMAPMDDQDYVIARAAGHEFLIGKTLREFAESQELRDPREAFVRLCAMTEMRGALLLHNIDEDLARRAIVSSRSFVASNAPGFGGSPAGDMLYPERSRTTFTKFLSLVQDENIMPLSDAIRKISYEPARFFGLPDRGELKPGAVADLVCFKGSEMKFTIVGGKIAVKDGEFLEVYNGKALRRK